MGLPPSYGQWRMLQRRSKLVKIMLEFQTAWIRVRRRVTGRLIRMQAVHMGLWSRSALLE